MFKPRLLHHFHILCAGATTDGSSLLPMRDGGRGEGIFFSTSILGSGPANNEPVNGLPKMIPTSCSRANGIVVSARDWESRV